MQGPENSWDRHTNEAKDDWNENKKINQVQWERGWLWLLSHYRRFAWERLVKEVSGWGRNRVRKWRLCYCVRSRRMRVVGSVLTESVASLHCVGCLVSLFLSPLRSQARTSPHLLGSLLSLAGCKRNRIVGLNPRLERTFKFCQASSCSIYGDAISNKNLFFVIECYNMLIIIDVSLLLAVIEWVY